MFRLIVGQRLKEDLLSYKTPVVLLVTSLLLAASVSLMLGDLTERREIYARNVSQQPDLAELIRPPALLSAVVRGVDTDIYGGKSVAGIRVERVPPEPFDNPVLALFPTPDTSSIVQYILSLFALMMAHDLITGPKEARTLALVFSSPVSRGTFFAAQCTGGLVGLGAAFGVGYLLAVTLVALAGGTPLGAEELARLAGIGLVSFLYLMVFFMLGATISTFSTSSGQALVVSLLTWVVLVLVLPPTLMLVAGQWREIPSVETVAASKNAARNEILGAEGAFRTEWPRANAATEAIDEAYGRQVEGQQALMRSMTRLSPSGSYVLAASTLAGTSVVDTERYVQSVRRFISRLRRYVYVERDSNPDASPPTFFAHRARFAGAVSRAGTDLTTLLAWLLLVGGVGLWRFRAYDVR